MEGLPLLTFKGSPYEIGKAIGASFSEPMRRRITEKKISHRVLGVNAESVIAGETRRFVSWCEKLAPHLMDEMRGYSDGSGVPFEDIVELNCTDEIRSRFEVQPPDGCTGFAVLPRASGEKLLTGQSKDGSGPLWKYYIVLRIHCDGHAGILQLGYPGSLALLGVSETGFSICTNQIYGGTEHEGIPVVLLKRLAWDSGNFDDFESLLNEYGVSVATNFVVCDGSGSAASYEMRGNSWSKLLPVEGVLVHTNHFLDPPLQGQEDESRIKEYLSRERRTRLIELLERYQGKIDPEKIFHCFRDHEGYPRGICSHETTGSGYGTTAVLVIEPQRGLFHLTTGRTCLAAPTTYGL